MQDFLYIEGYLDFYKPFIDDVRKYPELQPTPEFVEMTRLEQMKYLWERHAIRMKIDPKRYLYDSESSITYPSALLPAIDPTLLHYGMFMAVI